MYLVKRVKLITTRPTAIKLACTTQFITPAADKRGQANVHVRIL